MMHIDAVQAIIERFVHFAARLTRSLTCFVNNFMNSCRPHCVKDALLIVSPLYSKY